MRLSVTDRRAWLINSSKSGNKKEMTNWKISQSCPWQPAAGIDQFEKIILALCDQGEPVNLRVLDKLDLGEYMGRGKYEWRDKTSTGTDLNNLNRVFQSHKEFWGGKAHGVSYSEISDFKTTKHSTLSCLLVVTMHFWLRCVHSLNLVNDLL